MSLTGADRAQERAQLGSSGQVLYRFHSADGELLYVGISVDPGSRFKSHAREKAWWPLVARIELEHFRTREEVMDAERDAVRDEMPAFNVQLKAPRGEVVSLRVHQELKALDDDERPEDWCYCPTCGAELRSIRGTGIVRCRHDHHWKPAVPGGST